MIIFVAMENKELLFVKIVLTVEKEKIANVKVRIALLVIAWSWCGGAYRLWPRIQS